MKEAPTTAHILNVPDVLTHKPLLIRFRLESPVFPHLIFRLFGQSHPPHLPHSYLQASVTFSGRTSRPPFRCLHSALAFRDNFPSEVNALTP